MEETRFQQHKRAIQKATDQGESADIEAAMQIHHDLTDLNPYIEIDAKEFGEHVRNGGWRLGLLVARSVSLGEGQTAGLQNVVKDFTTSNKISARAFARQAGDISPPTVSKYLTSWDLAALDGHVPPSKEMVPGQAYEFNNEVHNPDLWNSYFKPPVEESNQTVYQFFKGLEKYNSCNLRDWIKVENFEYQSDFNPQMVYDLLHGVNSVAVEGMDMIIAVSEAMGHQVISDDS